MRVLWPCLLLAGCCELPEPLRLPGQECDSTPGGTGATGRTGDTSTPNQGIPLTGLNLTVPTGDDDYDRYAQAVWELPWLAGPGGGTAQLMEGMAGIQDTPSFDPAGIVYVEEGEVPLGAVERYVEHWFLDLAPQDYVGNRSVRAVSQWEPGAGWTTVMGEMPNWLSGNYQSRAYLCQDVVYTAVPNDMDLSAFDYIDQNTVPTRFHFDVTQNGQWRGSLLREQHNHAILGEIWVDFWTFVEGYELVGPEGADAVDFTLVNRQAPTLNLWIVDSPPAHRFARVIYKVLPGSQFQPELAADGCGHLFEI